MATWNVDVLLEGDRRGASSVLLTDGKEPVLVDTGMPHDAHRLLAALADRGLRPEDIHCLINTHFHIDHVSNNCLFPNSVIYATQQSYDWCIALYSALSDEVNWKKRTLKYYPEIFEYDKAAESMEKIRKIVLRWWDVKRIGLPSQFRWIERQTLPGDIETILTWGHVPGHASLLVRSGERTTVVAGDALLTRAYDENILTMIPYHRSQHFQDREKILSYAGTIIPGHGQLFQNSPDGLSKR